MKKQEPTIAEILHYAADYCLIATQNEYFSSNAARLQKMKYSCNAIDEAVCRLRATKATAVRIRTGLTNLGLDVKAGKAWPEDLSENRFNEIQQQRYAWLKFCALLAEEQGV